MTSNDSLQTELKKIVDESDVVLFMKGTAEFPQCGFSNQIASILRYLAVPFKDVNVLESDEMRQGIKDFTNWPTVPQLYIKGEFVGGCDIITEMTMSGEIDTMLEEKGIGFDKKAAVRIRETTAEE